MAHSFVSYGEADLRVNDFDLIALVFFLKAVDAPRNGEPLLKNMFAVWIDSIENDGAGNINLKLDSLLKTPEDLGLLLTALHNVKSQLAALPETIPADFLRKLIEVKGIEFGDYRKIFLENIANAFDEFLSNARKH